MTVQEAIKELQVGYLGDTEEIVQAKHMGISALEKQINRDLALDLAWRYGQIDGSHHKMWVIDQMIRTLCGSEEEYKKWVAKYNDDDYEWDCGIAP